MTTYKVQIKEDEFDHWKSLFIDEKVLLEIPEVDLIRIIKWNEFESKLGMTYKTVGRTHTFNIDEQKLSDLRESRKHSSLAPPLAAHELSCRFNIHVF